jgi:hypothetical protein
MAATPRSHTSPPELAKDVLGKLDNARAIVGRARAVAQRAGFQATDEQLATIEAAMAAAVDEVETAVRDDVRRLLTKEQ